MIIPTLICSCHWKTLAPFYLRKKRPDTAFFKTNSEFPKNRTEKQIMLFKTTVNWLFTDIWCYLVIGCFEWKTVVFRQTLARVYYILNDTHREKMYFTNSTGASDRSFYPTFNKRLGHLETLLTIHRPQNKLSPGSLCGTLVPSPQSKCPKRTFMLPQKYHVSVSNMLSKPLKCFMENEN